MIKQKQILYVLSFLLLIFACAVCFYSITHSSKVANEQLMRDKAREIERQIENNIKLKSKDLLLVINRRSLNTQKDLPGLLNEIKNIPGASGEYCIVDSNGVIHSASGKTFAAPIAEKTLKLAYANAYCVAAITGTSSSQKLVCLLVPTSPSSLYLLAEIISIESYLTSVLIDNLPVEPDAVVFFDEWGNKLSSAERNTELTTEKALLTDAADFSLNTENPLYQTGTKGIYHIFVPVPQPAGWFLAFAIRNTTQTDFQLDYSVPIFAVMLTLLLIFILVIFLDVINDKARKKKLVIPSTTDQLTGLLSAEGMYHAVKDFAQKHQITKFYLVCMDIANFGRINNMFGYAVGDSLLCAIAHVISQNQYCCARISADCFTFLTEYTEETFAVFKRKLYESIANHLGPEYLQMVVFKFGLYPIRDSQPDFSKIYDGARLTLMLAQKSHGKEIVIFDEQLQKNLELQQNIEINMIHALSKGEFELYVQPQFYLPEEICRRGEALIRWNSDSIGLLTPDKFIPIFENNGFIVEIDFYVLSVVLEYLQRRHDEGKPPITLAVNQSKTTISFPNYLARLTETVRPFTFPIKQLELEITESTLDADLNTIVPLMANIKKLGFTIAMDDFGSGFSSLNTLRMLPIDVLKIDRLFLQESGSSERSKIIIESVINLAKKLAMTVVCEGVESKAQLDFLKTTSCNIIQGYYYSKPIPLADFTADFLEN